MSSKVVMAREEIVSGDASQHMGDMGRHTAEAARNWIVGAAMKIKETPSICSWECRRARVRVTVEVEELR